MNNKSTITPDELETILNHIELLVQHLNNQENLSKEDLSSLEKIVFHIDGLLVKLHNESQLNIINMHVKNALNETNTHLKNILLNNENISKEYKSDHDQHLSNHLFSSITHQIQNLK